MIDAKRFIDELTKCEISMKEKSQECLYILTLNNRIHDSTSY